MTATKTRGRESTLARATTADPREWTRAQLEAYVLSAQLKTPEFVQTATDSALIHACYNAMGMQHRDTTGEVVVPQRYDGAGRLITSLPAFATAGHGAMASVADVQGPSPRASGESGAVYTDDMRSLSAAEMAMFTATMGLSSTAVAEASDQAFEPPTATVRTGAARQRTPRRQQRSKRSARQRHGVPAATAATSQAHSAAAMTPPGRAPRNPRSHRAESSAPAVAPPKRRALFSAAEERDGPQSEGWRHEAERARARQRVAAWSTGKDAYGLLATLGAFEHLRVAGRNARSSRGGPATSLERSDDASGAALRKAYHKASLQLHPDKLHGLPTPQRIESEEVFKVVSAVFADEMQRRDRS